MIVKFQVLVDALCIVVSTLMKNNYILSLSVLENNVEPMPFNTVLDSVFSIRNKIIKVFSKSAALVL